MATKLPHIVPPRGHEIELRTIAALIHLGEATNLRVQNAMLKLDQSCFTDRDHIALFELLLDLFNKKQSFDLVSMLAIVSADQYHIVDIAVKEEYCTVNYLEKDIEKLLDYKLLRKQLKILVDTINFSLEEVQPDQALNVIRDQVQLLSKNEINKQTSIVRSYETIADEFLNDTEEDNSQFCIDIPGIPEVPNRSLITIAGRSGHGKTFFAMYFMDKIIDARQGRQTLYFNLEMHERVMMERHAKLLGFHGENRRDVIKKGISHLLNKNVSLISEPMITIDQIESESRIASMKKPIAVIVVDYLGLVSSKTKYESNHLQQSAISKRLAALSIELDCIVIDLIQVNREFKARVIGQRCPIPTDSSDSMGSLHSATWWIGIDQPQLDDQSGEYKDLFQVRNRKTRGEGSLFELNFSFKNGMFLPYQRPFCAKPVAMPAF